MKITLPEKQMAENRLKYPTSDLQVSIII